MSGQAPSRWAVTLFLLKFVIIVAGLLLVWWWIVQPPYVWVAGQTAGILIRYVMGASLDGMRVAISEKGVLSTMTSLEYIYGDDTARINVAFLVANLPTYFALVLATSGIGWARRAKALAYGGSILFAGHVVFLVVMFTFAQKVQAAPEVPTAFGIFVMTLPFLLWIVFAYWEQALGWFEGTVRPENQPKNPPSV